MKTWDDTRRHLVLMLALTFTTGIVDAVGYLGLDRVFTANMTGNVVILGMAVVGAEDLPVLGPSSRSRRSSAAPHSVAGCCGRHPRAGRTAPA